MIRKALKYLLFLFVGIGLIALLSYAIFHLWEYSSGGKFVTYLEENSETVPLGTSFTYEILKDDLEKNKVILVGESHGFDEPSKFDVDFFKYLHKNYGVKSYFAELDFVQAMYMNEFLESGNENTLKEILKKWAVAQGRNNRDYFDKYISLHEYYQTLSEGNKFKFIGIDKFQDLQLVLKYLNAIDSNSVTASQENIPLANLVNHKLEELGELQRSNHEIENILAHLSMNMSFLADKTDRDSVMFHNFNKLYNEYGLTKEKVYGYFGLFHIFQYRINGDHPLASQIRESDLGLGNQLLSVNFLMNDSHMVMPSKKLPRFMQDDEKYTRMPISADNLLFMYIYGIKDFKRMTANHEKSLIKMNGEESPYSGSNRMNKTFQILPVTDIFEMTDKGKPYVQYTIFVRNSDWAEPM